LRHPSALAVSNCSHLPVNVTGVTFFTSEVVAKRLQFLRELVPDPGVRQQGHRLMPDLLGIRKVLLGQIFQRMTACCECDPLSETTASSARRASSSHSFARRNQTNLCRSISDEAAS
jgi:hypothetical protein